MKKCCLTGIALMLTLSLMMSTALAVDATIMRVDKEAAEEQGFYPSVERIITIGDTVYMLGQTTENSYARDILRWQPGMETVEPYLSGLLYSRYFDNAEDAAGAIETREMDVDAEHGISILFSDGERLMALDHLNGKIFTITAKDGKPVYEDVTTVANTDFYYHKSEEYAWFIQPDQIACASGKLLWSSRDWDDATGRSLLKTYCIDLNGGSVKVTSLEDTMRLVRYKDGKLLVLTRNEETAYDNERNEYRPMEIIVYDPVSDKGEKVGELAYRDWRPDLFAYAPELDALIYNDNTRVMGLFDGLRESKQIGYIPMSYVNACDLIGDSVVLAGNVSGVMVRTLSKNFRSDVYVNVFNGYMDDASRAFAEDYPQIPIYSVTTNSSDAATIDRLMKSGADAPDIMQLNTATSVFTRLVEKKGCEDLSGNEKLAAYVNNLYPVYRDAVTGPNGEIYAIPIHAYSWDGYFINRKVMEDMKLTIDEMPTNLVELCAFVTRWNDEFVDQYPNYNAVEYFSKYKADMFDMAVDRYIAYCGATGEAVKFDTPVFRELVAAIEGMQTKALEESLKSPDPEKSDYKQGLIWHDDLLVGSWWDYTADSSDRIFIPMGLTKDAGYYTGANVLVMFINSRSEHKEAAIKLLEYMADDVTDQNAYTLLATKDQPLENEGYERWKKRVLESIEKLEKKLAEAPEEEKADWKTQLDDEKAFYDQYKESMRYTITPGSLKNYRETIMPCVYVATPSFRVNGEERATKEFDSLISQYKDGKIDINRFIREADGKLMMMQSE